MKGVIHIHTDYSNDSDCSLAQLAQRAKGLGYGFLIITDHFEDIIDPTVQQNLINDCNRLTSRLDGLTIIPGLEIRLKDKAHILMIGLKKPITQSDVCSIECLRDSAKAQGALLGVAHLSYKFNLSIEELYLFDFIEGWNIQHDMKFPSYKNLRIAQNLSNSCILGGLDLHHIDELGSLQIKTEENSIIDAIRQKKVITMNSFIAIDSHGNIIRNQYIYYIFYIPFISIKTMINLIGKLFVFTGWVPPKIIKRIKKYLIG